MAEPTHRAPHELLRSARRWRVAFSFGLYTLLSPFGYALFAVASSRGQVSLTSVLASLYPVVTAVLARIVLDERLRRIQQAGVVLAVGGAVLIAV